MSSPSSAGALSLPSRPETLSAFCQRHGIAPTEFDVGMLRMSLRVAHVTKLSARRTLAVVSSLCDALKPKLDDPSFPTDIKRHAFRSDSLKPDSYILAPLIDGEASQELCTKIACQFRQDPDGDLDYYYAVMEVLLRSAFKPYSPGLPPQLQRVYDACAQAFSSTYMGDAHLRLNRCIRDEYREKLNRRSTRSRIVPIIQSSGTGKTRMVYELGTIWPTLILHPRRRPDDPSDGFPTADEPLVDFFQHHAATFANPPFMVVAFLTAWFTVAAENIKERAATESISSMAQIFQPWWFPPTAAEVGRSSRLALIKEVCKMALELGKTHPVMMRQEEKLHKEFIEVERLISAILNPAIDELAGALVALEPVRRSVEALPGWDRGMMYVAIDDFGLLGDFALLGGLPPADMLWALRKCIARASQHWSQNHRLDLWFLLLDTDSAIDREPFPEIGPSSRFIPYDRLPLWTDVPLDVLVPKARALRCPDDALSLEHLKLFGRPLWNASSYEEISAAMSKLTGTASGSYADLKSPAVVVSLLSQRCCLELLPLGSDTPAAKIAVTAIRNHMRYLVGVGSDGICKTTVPSEPMLALAAWKVMTSDRHSYHEVLWTFYHDVLSRLRGELGLCGSVGKFLARLLLTMGRDAVHVTSRPVSLRGFLKGLVSWELFPAISSHASIKDLPTAWTSFTHIVALDDALSVARPSFLWNLWKRSAAVQCGHNPLGVDGLIPVFVGDNTDLTWSARSDGEETSSGEAEDDVEAKMAERMSFIAWKVKCRGDAAYHSEHLHGPSIRLDKIDKHWQASSLLTLVLDLTPSTYSVEKYELFSLSEERCSAPFCSFPGTTPVLKLAGATEKTFGCISNFDAGSAIERLDDMQEAAPTEKRLCVPIKHAWPMPNDTSHKPPFAIVEPQAMEAGAAPTLTVED